MQPRKINYVIVYVYTNNEKKKKKKLYKHINKQTSYKTNKIMVLWGQSTTLFIVDTKVNEH